MAKPYDYVQIVHDDDWSLVGIVPSGDIGNKMRNMSTHNNKTGPLLASSNVTHKVSEAIVVNASRRRPVTKIITRSEPSEKLITPAETAKDQSLRQNPHALTGIVAENNTHPRYRENITMPDSSELGNLSSLAVTRTRDNVLVGFGK